MAEKGKVENDQSLSTKSILSQVLATTAQNLMLLNLGLAITFPSIVIPHLLEAGGKLSLTKEQASWFGSIGLILQPVGSILSGTTMEPLGRKKSLMLVNLPHMAAWIIMYLVQDVTWLFIGNIIIGLGVGFMEAPLMTYVGEICHPKIRGVLTGYSQIFVGIGFFLSYILGSLFSWRNTALISLSIPIITFIIILAIVPETPIWFISKGRLDDAMKSLCWVRGWTEPSMVQQEFDDIVKYQKDSTACQQCSTRATDQTKCPHREEGCLKSLKELYENMTRKEMLRPLSLVIFVYMISQFTGVMPIKPNLVNIYRCFGLPIDPSTAANITSGLGVIALIILMCVIKYSGKRLLLLSSLLVISVSNLFIGLYAYQTLPPGFTTYSNEVIIHNPESTWIPTLFFIVLHGAYYMGAGPIPWLILSEIFPLRGRGHAVGLAAAFSYIFCAFVTKTHLNMELTMGVHGTFWLYSGVTIFGMICLYFYFPDTEGKKFEEIEKEFSGRRMKVVANDIVTRYLMRLFSHRRNTVDPNYQEGKITNIEEDTLLQIKMQQIDNSTKL